MSLDKFKKFQKDKTIQVIDNKELWGYTRVSSKDQYSNYSLDEQKADIARMAKEKHFETTKMLGGTYESASGDFTRKEFNKLIDEVRRARKKPYAIAIRTINRFSRTGGSAIAIVNELVEKLGVHLLETSSGLCTDNEYDKLEIYRKLLEARKENLERMKITIPGMKALLRSGGWLGKPPRGYTLKGKKVTDSSRIQAHQEIFINEEGKHLIKAWKWKVTGERDVAIRKRLEDLGVHITKQGISEMWKKPFYCGISVNALLDEPQRGKWEPMVSESDFWKIQAIIEGKKPNAKKEYSKSKICPERPLTGFLKCSCGMPLTSYPIKKKNLHYYKCQKCKDASFNAHTTQKSVFRGLDNLFEELLVNYSIDERFLKPFRVQLERTFEDMNKEGYDELEAAKGLVTSVRSKLDRLEHLYIENPDFGHDKYNRLNKEYTEELNVRLEQIENAQKKISNHQKHIDKILDTVQNISKIWAYGDIENKLRVQNLVFPEGLTVDPKNRQYLTKKVNAIFSLVPTFTGVDKVTANKKPTSFTDGSVLVAGTGLEPVTFGL